MLGKCGVPDNFKKSNNTKFFGYLVSQFKDLTEYVGKSYRSTYGTTNIYKDKSSLYNIKGKLNFMYIVSIDIEDIVEVTHDRIKCKKVKIENEVTLDTTQQDDILLLLEEMMYS